LIRDWDILHSYKDIGVAIKEPYQLDKKLETVPMDAEWKQSLKTKFWSSKYKGGLETLCERNNIDIGHMEKLMLLKEKLLEFGGDEVCIHLVDDDIDKILNNGQLWCGDHVKYEEGETGQCHRNSINLWYENKHRLAFATGYALSEDGMWRCHSWCIDTYCDNRVVETTEPRVAYFGVVFTDEESEYFYNDI
jgi:hypothetical protein